ncbi:MAG: hypothetical protein JXA46_12270 [Dehalococcoidales bacterium]|nr:hypothetical protein [Dehalococcoidales bacterium]
MQLKQNEWSIFGLKYNPFPPATAGIDIREGLWIPESWKKDLENIFGKLHDSTGPKALALIGRYGSGKTYVLRYLENYFVRYNVIPYFFDNPGADFYSLANMLMRKVGRYEFSKGLWELSKISQRRLIDLTFGEWLQSIAPKMEKEKALNNLQGIIRNELKLTEDEEVAYRLALVVVQTTSKPYFDYRDFVEGKKDSLVAEKQEPEYFRALIRALIRINNVQGVAFLIDEFEEVSAGRRISKREGHEYLDTLQRLIDLSEKENLWIVASMTDEGLDTTRQLSPALWERVPEEVKLNPLSDFEAKSLLMWWLDRAKLNDEDKGKLSPFPDDIVSLFRKKSSLIPRLLVKFGFFLLSEAISRGEGSQITSEVAQKVLDELFPEEAVSGK